MLFPGANFRGWTSNRQSLLGTCRPPILSLRVRTPGAVLAQKNCMKIRHPRKKFMSLTVREGTSDDTLSTPEDFPADYNYGSGLSGDWGDGQLYARLPEPEGNATVLNTAPDLTQIQDLYLWEEGNAPAQTEVTRDGYDPADFCPYVTAIPVRAGTEVKGAVVLLAGGAFQARANYTDTLPTAAHLRELGFQTFIVDYRLHPYTQQEGALDVARAVRFIRKNADAYDIDPDDIAVMGYSAGGIQAGEFFLNFDEDVLPTALDSDYIPDELDEVAAHASAAGIIYSFYGRLSVASMDAEELRSGDLPPTFYCYGTEDPFYRQFEAQYDLMQDVGVLTKRIVLQDWPHGFGGDGGWVEDYAQWLEQIFTQN
ncbi:MAG: alpha/beta hydrolase [Clostridiales bacterium]|nr:alpha/beta hydrolase [Clostridiales bacterium]